MRWCYEPDALTTELPSQVIGSVSKLADGFTVVGEDCIGGLTKYRVAVDL